PHLRRGHKRAAGSRTRRRSPTAGPGKSGRVRAGRARRRPRRRRGGAMTFTDADPSTHRANDEASSRLRRALEGVIGVPATEGNQIDVLRNGDEIFPAMLDAIARAEHTVDFLTFVYWRGEIGVELAHLLADRAQAGVRVRVLLDGWGARPIDPELIRLMEGCGVQVRWFRPLRRFHPGQFNHRTHRKVLIVDEAVG